jgi:hypothetical protein
MAITRLRVPTGASEEHRLDLSFDNGDRQALRQVVEQYNFIGEQEALRFALAVLLKNEGEGVYIEENGSKVLLTPSDKVIKPQEAPSESPTPTAPAT